MEQTPEQILDGVNTPQLMAAWAQGVLHRGHGCKHDNDELTQRYRKELRDRGFRLTFNNSDIRRQHPEGVYIGHQNAKVLAQNID